MSNYCKTLRYKHKNKRVNIIKQASLIFKQKNKRLNIIKQTFILFVSKPTLLIKIVHSL